jgi:hypothetical protein
LRHRPGGTKSFERVRGVTNGVAGCGIDSGVVVGDVDNTGMVCDIDDGVIVRGVQIELPVCDDDTEARSRN